MTDTIDEINDYLKSESYDMRRSPRPPANRRAMDLYGGRKDPGPAHSLAGLVLNVIATSASSFR